MIADSRDTTSSDDRDYEKDRVAWNLPTPGPAGDRPPASRDFHAKATDPKPNGVSRGLGVTLTRRWNA